MRITAALATTIVAMTVGLQACQSTALEEAAVRDDDVSAAAQGWSRDDQKTFYKRSQGSAFIPISWLVALEKADSDAPFLDKDYLAQFGVTVDSRDPDHLPVGYVRTTLPGEGTFAGPNCSFCHTAELEGRRGSIRIHGGAGLVNFVGFNRALLDALRALEFYGDPSSPMPAIFRSVLRGSIHNDKARRFVEAVEDYEYQHDSKTPEDTQWERMTALVFGGLHLDIATDPGLGRMDATALGVNTLGKLFNERNYIKDDGPISIPPLWNTHKYDWRHTTGSVKDSFARNMVQALGAGVRLQPSWRRESVNDNRIALYAKDFDPQGLDELETAAEKLAPPQWPSIFKAIEATKAARGKTLYDAHCGSCHDLHEVNGEIALHFVPLQQIGTDPVAVRHFDVQLDSGGLTPWPGSVDVLLKDFTMSLQSWFTNVDDNPTAVSEETMTKWTRGRANLWQRPEGYYARPLAGIWATAPFLHNGSVPSLYDLLLPGAQRPASFHVDTKCVYDDEKVGFDNCKTGSHFLPGRGNSNQGHEYGTQLSDPERRDLVEYLKTL